MEFIGQIRDFKAKQGQSKLTIDVFDATPAKDLASLTLLAMGETVVRVTLEESISGVGTEE